ncbi:MAG: GPR endopeptidase, partial [Clostridia bacterium]|nr:GPR endopeptidase [Clostridia bacterium]
MGYRTDLAAEARAEHGELDGVEVRTRTVEDVTVTETVISTAEAAEKLGKSVGRYITLELAGLKTGDVDEEDAGRLIAEELKPMLREGGVLVAGLGNRRVTPD